MISQSKQLFVSCSNQNKTYCLDLGEVCHVISIICWLTETMLVSHPNVGIFKICLGAALQRRSTENEMRHFQRSKMQSPFIQLFADCMWKSFTCICNNEVISFRFTLFPPHINMLQFSRISCCRKIKLPLTLLFSRRRMTNT